MDSTALVGLSATASTALLLVLLFLVIRASSAFVLPEHDRDGYSPIGVEEDAAGTLLYTDEDGSATDSSQAEFSDREPRLWILISICLNILISGSSIALHVVALDRAILTQSIIVLVLWVCNFPVMA